MNRALKIFLVVMILLEGRFSAVEAKVEVQDLRSRAGVILPVLPEKIRYRNSRRGPTKVIVQPVEIPRYRQVKEPPIYTQRQPKRPSPMYIQRRKTRYPRQRGTYPPKNFNPPRARYK